MTKRTTQSKTTRMSYKHGSSLLISRHLSLHGVYYILKASAVTSPSPSAPRLLCRTSMYPRTPSEKPSARAGATLCVCCAAASSGLRETACPGRLWRFTSLVVGESRPRAYLRCPEHIALRWPMPHVAGMGHPSHAGLSRMSMRVYRSG